MPASGRPTRLRLVVVDRSADKISLGIDAPRSVQVWREELVADPDGPLPPRKGA